jgi:hypothetical protein
VGNGLQLSPAAEVIWDVHWLKTFAVEGARVVLLDVSPALQGAVTVCREARRGQSRATVRRQPRT